MTASIVVQNTTTTPAIWFSTIHFILLYIQLALAVAGNDIDCGC